MLQPFRAQQSAVLLGALFNGIIAMPVMASAPPTPTFYGVAVGAVIKDTEQARLLLKKYDERPEQRWAAPAEKDLPKNVKGAPAELIHYGKEILTHTAQRIGPHAANPKLRHAGNNLDCKNCHMVGDAGLPGTKPYALPLVNVINDYPKLDVKNMTVVSLQDRIRGMIGNGAVPIRDDSREMRAIIAYLTWLNRRAKPGMRMAGTGLKELNWPKRAANPAAGKALYQQQCSICHGVDGQGMRKPDFASGGGYVFPPVAGDDTYTDGGHMYMVPLMARFIHENMPLGVGENRPQLTVAQALDISAYINSELKRRHEPKRAQAYPDPAFRPEGFAIPEHFKGDEKAYQRARFGPYQSKHP